jgi:hypothetical protein
MTCVRRCFTAALLLLYCCFTDALLLLYSDAEMTCVRRCLNHTGTPFTSFTGTKVQILTQAVSQRHRARADSQGQRLRHRHVRSLLHFTAALLLLYCCSTAALLLLYCCFTAALLLLYLLGGFVIACCVLYCCFACCCTALLAVVLLLQVGRARAAARRVRSSLPQQDIRR